MVLILVNKLLGKLILGIGGIRDPHLNFEIAYSDKEIRVYDGRNGGFWVCEYISMNKDHESFNSLKEALFQKLQEVFGIG